MLSFIFKEITGESLDNYNHFSTIRIFSNKRCQEHTQKHVDFLESLRTRKYIVLNKRKMFFTWLSFEGGTLIRFNYKSEHRMQALLEFKELMMRIGQTL